VILGVDPGQNGALAVIDDNGALIVVDDMPVVGGHVNAVLVGHWLRDHGSIHLAVIEDCHSMPGQGVASSFKFGRAKGVVEGVVGALGLPVEMPSPTMWKRAMGVTKDKETTRALAIELWPEHVDRFKRKKDADRAEAALLAEYGRRRLAERRSA
jgi:hypothetical protein